MGETRLAETGIGNKEERRNRVFRGMVPGLILTLLLLGLVVADTAAAAGPPYVITDNVTGGDCTAIGTWNPAHKSCTLTTDLNVTVDAIHVVSDDIILNGNGHTITGNLANGYGVLLIGRTGVTIRNLTIDSAENGIRLENSSNITIRNVDSSNNYYYGILLGSSDTDNLIVDNIMDSNGNSGLLLGASSDNNTITGNTISNNNVGVAFDNASNNSFYNNNIVNSTTTQIADWAGTGNVFSMAMPTGGNYWDDYDTPAEGCFDTDNDGICDAPYIFSGGQDDRPFTNQDGWNGCWKPTLTLTMGNVYWGTFDEYTWGILSIDWEIDNTGANDAFSTWIIGSTNTNGVTLNTSLPVPLGDVASGGSVPFTLKYNIPVGVPAWNTTTAATAEDACGSIYYYP